MVSHAMGIEIHISRSYYNYEVNKLGDIIKTNPISLFNKTNLAIFVILIANLAPMCLQRDVQTHQKETASALLRARSNTSVYLYNYLGIG